MEQYSELVHGLLAARDVTDPGAFFARAYAPHDPFLMRDMERATERVLRAIGENERIMIHGDYDADGVCAAALMHRFLRAVGHDNFYVALPHRRHDGYGISEDAVREAAQGGVALIITADCGIAARDEIALARELGVDVVVTDHHLPQQTLPEAYAIVNPTCPGDTYPWKCLSGTGVAWKLVQALFARGDFPHRDGWEKWFLDLVAIATIADMMPLRDENRVLVHHGLEMLRGTRIPGLYVLAEALRLSLAYVTEDDIAFSIAPALNVAGRMEHADIAFDLLTTSDSGSARSAVARLLALKDVRKREVGLILDAVEVEKETPVIVAGDESWHPGVVGLAAARLAELHGKPAFVWGKGDGDAIRGSARSDGSVDLIELMALVPDGIFSERGGHAHAAGFGLNGSVHDDLTKALAHAYAAAEKRAPEKRMPEAVLGLADVEWGLYAALDQFSPFGEGNQKPLFRFARLPVAAVERFGSARDHLRMRFDGGLSAIAFFAGDAWRVRAGDTVDVIGSLEKNVFRGRPELRIRIADVLSHA